MGAPASHARLVLTPPTRTLLVAFALASSPALGCVVSLDGLTGGDGSKSDATAPATPSSSGGGESPVENDAGTATTPQGGQTPPTSPDAAAPTRDDDSGTVSTGGGPDDASTETDTSTASASAGPLVFGAPTSASSSIGENNGAAFAQTCPSGAALVGLNLVSDTASPFSLYQVAPICAAITLTSAGTLTFAAPTPLTLEGDDASDGVAGTLSCPSGSVITGISATAEKYVHSVIIQCQVLTATASGGGFAIGLGNAGVVGPFGNTTGGYSTFTYVCPSSLVANALAGSAGVANFLDSIQLGCATPSSP